MVIVLNERLASKLVGALSCRSRPGGEGEGEGEGRGGGHKSGG